MRRILALAVLGLASIPLATAAPACQNGSLAFYQGTYGSTGCSVGNFLFSNFSYVSVSAFANPVTAGNINITTVDGVNGPQLQFSGSWQDSGLGTSEAGILFHVDSLDQAFGLNGVTLNATGNRTGALSTAVVTEVDCLGGSLTPFTGLGTVACLSGARVDTSAGLPVGTSVNASGIVQFSPLGFHADILKDIFLTGALGTSSITSLGQSFGVTAVPEPQTCAMLLAGLGAIAVRRRRQSR